MDRETKIRLGCKEKNGGARPEYWDVLSKVDGIGIVIRGSGK